MFGVKIVDINDIYILQQIAVRVNLTQRNENYVRPAFGTKPHRHSLSNFTSNKFVV
jgi:hypothetical protein